MKKIDHREKEEIYWTSERERGKKERRRERAQKIKKVRKKDGEIER